jgi:hypothetical protein
MKLSNGREVGLIIGCILETEDRLHILCEDDGCYRLLDMECGILCNERYSTIKEIEKTLDYKFRRIVYDGVVTPEENEFIDVEMGRD